MVKDWKFYCLVTFFEEEDDSDQEEDKYSLGCDASDEDSLISDMDGGDDYWTFMENPVYETLENLIENLIYDMSNKGSVYSEICGSPIYDTSIEGSVDLETWESFGMEEEHSKFSFDYSDL